MVQEQPTQAQTRARLSLPPIVQHVVGAVAFGTLAAWLLNALVCYHSLWGWCGGKHYVTLAGLVALGVIGPISLSFRDRAIRRSRRGMWAKGWSGGPSHELAATFSKAARLIVGEEEEPAGVISGARRFERRGWWVTVPIGNGRAVWVDRWRLWRWLVEVGKLQARLEAESSRESAIGQRLWESRKDVGRDLWMAYMIILEEAGAIETRTPDPRSRRYVGGEDAWGWVEEYEKVRKSEER